MRCQNIGLDHCCGGSWLTWPNTTSERKKELGGAIRPKSHVKILHENWANSYAVHFRWRSRHQSCQILLEGQEARPLVENLDERHVKPVAR